MKTLYVSDLDGTLLRGDATLSPYTARILGELTDKGVLFSYATARSYITAAKVTAELKARIPLIVYNGTFIVDNSTGKTIRANTFAKPEAHALLADLLAHGIVPIVYAMLDGAETFSLVPHLCSEGLAAFAETRRGDPRERRVNSTDALYDGEIFYFTCIDMPEKLEPLYRRYGDIHHCLLQKDVYSDSIWLEIMPRGASKSNASLQLKQILGCDRLVVFGDGQNDLDLFRAADEAYAVANAVAELKEAAHGIIGSNGEDGVARWLAEHAQY